MRSLYPIQCTDVVVVVACQLIGPGKSGLCAFQLFGHKENAAVADHGLLALVG